MKGLFVSGILVFLSFGTVAGEKPGCDGFLIAQHPQSPTPRSFGPFDCEDPKLSQLNDNRAQLFELMSDFNSLNQAVSADKTTQAYYQAYRIFIALAESFAVQAMARGDLEVLSRLNETYRQYIEITQLRLKGYDLIANRLERELR